MQVDILRQCLIALALSAGVLLGGCDDAEGGVGASVSLPSVFASSTTDPTDRDAGSVHWVGNPRW
jgi:hypothetical protein